MNPIGSNFLEERAAFKTFRAQVEAQSALKAELVAALAKLIHDYDTAVWENRFVVGGAVEHIIGSAMRAADLVVYNRGKREINHDIELQSGGGFSCKSVFTRPSDIRIKNFMGKGSKWRWETATVIVAAGVGIGYVDPLLLADVLENVTDAAILPKRIWLPFLTTNDCYLIKAPIVAKGKGGRGGRLRPSYLIAEEILMNDEYELLRLNRTSLKSG